MADEERHPAWDQIEAAAAHDKKHFDLKPGEHEIELSKAISLKRIADTLAQMVPTPIEIGDDDDE